ncbi:MAG TPA: hypothetical protein VLI90_01025, partial [Tepidisphaeraceae bacterium]|nr:hypothetical protein [Tepidisphaeraceae bacterium]
MNASSKVRAASGFGVGSRRRTPVSSAAGHAVEALEGRRLLSANAWKAAVSGDWDTASNWSAGHVPTASEDVSIAIAGNYTVTHSFGTDSAHSVTLIHPLTISGGVLTVATTVQANSTFTLSGGTLGNATINAGAGGHFIPTSGTLNHVTLGADVTMANGNQLTIVKGLSLGGHTLTLSSGGSYTGLIFNDAAAQSLSGPGKVVFAGTTPNTDFFNTYGSAAAPVTLAASISANGGIIQSLAGVTGALSIQAPITMASAGNTLTLNTFTNKSTMTVSAGAITFGGAWVNQGTVAVTNAAATLNLGGTFGAIGTINHSAGTVNLTGTDTVNGTLALTAATGSWNLAGGTLINATLSFAGGAALVPTSSGGTFNHVTLGSDLSFPNNGQITVIKGLSLNSHKVTLASTSAYTGIIFNDSAAQTLSGPGQVLLAGSSPSTDFFNCYGGASNPLTLAANVTINASGGLLQGLGGPASGFVIKSAINMSSAAGNLSISSFTNQGTLTDSAGTVTLGGPWANSGTIVVNNAAATLNLGGTFSKVGTINHSAGTVNLMGTGTINGTLAFTAATGSWKMAGGTLVNATLSFAGGASLVLTSSGGTFNHVTLGSDLTFGNNGQITVVKGLLLNSHTITLASTAAYTGIIFNDSAAQSLSGPGQVIFAGTSPNTDFFNCYGAAAIPVTLGSGVTISAAGGLIQNLGGATAGLINAAAITVTTGTLTLNGSLTNKGTLFAKGGNIVDNGAELVNSGTILVATGHSLTMAVPTATLTNSGGGVLSGTGTIVAPTVINSATVSPGAPLTPGTAAAGKLTITGNFTQTASGTLRAELGGTAGGAFDVLAVSGTAALAGLLDVYTFNGFHPAKGNVFGVMTYKSHTGAFTSTDGLSIGNGVALTAAATGTRETLTGVTMPADATAPTVSAPTLVGTPAKGGTTLQFKMTFSDNIAIDIATLGNGDLLVTGPNGFSQLATFVSVSKASNGSPRTAIYQLAAPGGTLDALDSGTYTAAV